MEGNIRLGPLRLPPLRQLGPILLMLGISLLLFLVIRELGLALLIYGIFLSMLYLGSGKLSYVIGGLLVFVALGFIGYKLFGYIQVRFAAVSLDVVNWQNWSQATIDFSRSGAYQIVQGIIALASGGIIGVGFGLGHAGALVSVPQSDMIFTALGEEFGLAGLFAIIGIYLLILYRGYRIAIEASNEFDQLLAAGLTSILAIQTVIILAGNMKFLPLTGIPLPLLSYGGSSIIANVIIIGILLRISHNADPGASITPALLNWGGLPNFGPHEIERYTPVADNASSSVNHPEIELLPEAMLAFFDEHAHTAPRLQLPWWLRKITVSSNNPQG